MGRFLYTTKKGKTTEEFFSCGKAPDEFRSLDGTMTFRDIGAECDEIAVRARRSPSNGTGIYPFISDALGVHPSQRKEAYEHSVKHGCETNFPECGGAEIRNEKHHNALKRSIGCYDRNAGYSGVTPK